MESPNLHKQPSEPTKNKRLLPLLLALAVIGAGVWYFFFFDKQNVPDNLKSEYVKIPTGTSIENLAQMLESEGFITDKSAFLSTADRLDYRTPRAGRFKITAGWGNKELINHLKLGKQAAVKVVLNNERKPEQIAGKIAKVLENDSLAYLSAFQNTVLLDSLGIKPTEFMCYMLPNTYNFDWNTTPRKFLERMKTEFDRYWAADDRIAKAKAQGLTPQQAVTMASIVEGETKYDDERPRVAGVYLNRLHQNMKLQADPTVQYALMEIEKTNRFRRLLYVDYLTPHPYNTYVHTGLPPGPIGMPQPSAIKAVLEPEQHSFIYFCAKPDPTGYHNFAVTLSEHNANVEKFQAWMRTQRNAAN